MRKFLLGSLLFCLVAAVASAQSVSHSCPNGPPTTGPCEDTRTPTYHDGPNDNRPNPPTANQLRERAFVEAYNQGNALYRAGNWDGALDKYRAAINLHPGDNDTKFMIGSATYMLGNYDFNARLWFKGVGGKRKGEAKELINKIETRLRANGWNLYNDGTAWRGTGWDNSTNQQVCEQADKNGNVSRVQCRQ